MKKLNDIKPGCLRPIALMILLGILMLVCSIAQAANDTTIFRIKVLQDSVYAGQPVDVEFYIEKPKNAGIQNGVLNLLGQFEMEVVTDTSRTLQHQTSFNFDPLSLSSFFNTLFSNLQTTSVLNPVTGALNMKVKSNKGGSGNARVGKGQYIVQDNAAGRQQMQFYFTKAIAKSLLGFNFPVKVITDSVYVIGHPTPIIKPIIHTLSRISRPKELKIYPNPATDYINLEGESIQQYTLTSIDGNTVTTVVFLDAPGPVTIPMDGLPAGFYMLHVQVAEIWETYRILKK